MFWDCGCFDFIARSFTEMESLVMKIDRDYGHLLISSDAGTSCESGRYVLILITRIVVTMAKSNMPTFPHQTEIAMNDV